MADQHNANIPALTNQVAEDIPDIKENLEFHKDAFERIIETWSDSDNSSAKLDTVPGFNDGTYNYEFPTNGVAGHSVIMLGDSDTVVWMYLNAAPPGWKALATGADMVCGIAGGADAYNVNGGNPDGEATWVILCPSAKWYDYIGGTSVDKDGAGNNLAVSANRGVGAIYITAISTQNQRSPSADQYTAATNSNGSWRPKASVGKLFQLDTA